MASTKVGRGWSQRGEEGVNKFRFRSLFINLFISVVYFQNHSKCRMLRTDKNLVKWWVSLTKHGGREAVSYVIYYWSYFSDWFKPMPGCQWSGPCQGISCWIGPHSKGS